MPGIADTWNFDEIIKHYYWSHNQINPSRVVPVGPVYNFDDKHDRDRVFGEPAESMSDSEEPESDTD